MCQIQLGYVDLARIPAVRMCTCMLANLPFFAPDVGVGIGVVGIESVDGEHISLYTGIIAVFASG